MVETVKIKVMQTSSHQPVINSVDELRRGLEYHQAAQFEKAREIYSKLLAIDPQHPDALHLLGVLELESGNLDNAENLIVKAIQVDPAQPTFYNNLGNVLLQQECLSEAVVNYQKAIEIYPKYADAWYNLGNTHMQLEQNSEAISNYLRALDIEPDFVNAWFNLGRAYRLDSEIDQAIDCFKMVVSLRPEYADGYDELAASYWELSQPGKAIFYYEKSLEIRPQCWNTYFNLGNIFREQAKLDWAIQCYREAIKLNPQSSETLLNMAIAQKAAGNLSDAEKLYFQCIRISPDMTEAYYNLGNLFKDTGQYPQAIQNYRKSLSINPKMRAALINLAEIYRHQRLFDEAVECLKRVIEIKPDDPDALHNLANVLIELHRPEEAIVMFKQVLNIEPDLNLAFNGMGSAYLALDRMDEAAACYRKALSIDPANPMVLFNLGVTSQSKGEYDESKEYFRKALNLDPEFTPAEWHYNLILPVLYDNEKEISYYRQRFEKGLDHLISNTKLKTPEQCRQALNGISGKTNFYLPYQGRNDAKLQEKYGNFAVQIMSASYPQWAGFRSMPPLKPGTKIRIGFVSSYLYSHTVGIFLKGWVDNIKHDSFETYGYHIGKKADNLTKFFKDVFDNYYQVAESLEQAASKIVSDDLHLLVFTDIGMNPLALQLAALRLAPVQCTGWGHPVTTGLPTIDYFLSSDLMEPDNAEDHYMEKLIRLPNLALCYQKPDLPNKPVTRNYFGIDEEAFVYLSPQSLFKYLPQYDDIFPRIAQNVANTKFVFISHQSESVTRDFKARLGDKFAKYKLTLESYCLIVPRLNFDDFLCLNLVSNVLLDTPDWSGAQRRRAFAMTSLKKVSRAAGTL